VEQAFRPAVTSQRDRALAPEVLFHHAWIEIFWRSRKSTHR
jgi:hypothetical protein